MRGSDSLKMLSLKKTIEYLEDDELKKVYKFVKKRKKKLEQDEQDEIFKKTHFEDLPEKFKDDLKKCCNFRLDIRSHLFLRFCYENIYIKIYRKATARVHPKHTWHIYFSEYLKSFKGVNVSKKVNPNDASTPYEYIAFFITIKLKKLFN